MLICRLTNKTGGHGSWKNQTFTLFVVRIIFRLLIRWLALLWMGKCSGKRISLWRLWFSLGACLGIGCQPKMIYLGVVFSTMILVCVLLGVALWKPLIIYFYIVLCLGLFGTLLIAGLAFQRLFRSCHQSISSNSTLVVGDLRCDIIFWPPFSLLLCGNCGKKEITGFSKV